ncbi:unnamed protein product [Arabidopsis halleri]
MSSDTMLFFLLRSQICFVFLLNFHTFIHYIQRLHNTTYRDFF